jgi:hypothetical protein
MARGYIIPPSAAQIAEYGGRGYGRPGGVALDTFTGGAFTRSTVGTYLTQAPTDGSSAFLAEAAINALRIENRGDGLGDMLLLEGARTNAIALPRDATPGAGNWTNIAGVFSANAGLSPDGLTLADRVQCTLGQAGVVNTSAFAGAGTFCGSAWVRRMPSAGAGFAQVSLDTGGVGDASSNPAISETYSRASVVATVTAGGWWRPWDGTGSYGGVAQALDYLADFHQVESGYFPSSAFPTTGTRASDNRSFPVGQYPASFLTSGFQITLAPDSSSADGLAGILTQYVLSTVLNQDYVTLEYVGGVMRVRARAGAVIKLESANLTWSRGALLTITVRPAAGTLTLSGFSSGNGTTVGTPFSFVSGTLYLGSNATNASGRFFGRVGRYMPGL